ncbi:MAG: hypothetical protein RJB66_379 [Pseudomonadota bacterium]|jgi:anti-sigma regulatory factor (Ser/Thr protein kinase)
MKKQIIGVFVATILLTGLLSIILFVRREKEVSIHWLTENSRSQLDLMSDLLSTDLEKMKNQLGRVATLMEAGLFEEAQKALAPFLAVGAMDSHSLNFLWKVQTHGLLKDEFSQAWAKKLNTQGLEGGGVGYYASQVAEGEIRSSLTIPAKVKDRRSGQVSNVRLVGILPQGMFQDLVDRLKSQGIHAFLTTDSGLTLAHTVSEYLGNSMIGDKSYDLIRQDKNLFGSIKTKDVRGEDILSFFVKIPASKLILVSQWRKDLWVTTDWMFYGQGLLIILALSLLGGGLAQHLLQKLGQPEVVIREVPVERIVERVVEKVVEKPVFESRKVGFENGVIAEQPKGAPSPVPSLPQRPFSMFNSPTSVGTELPEPQVSLRVLEKVVAALKAPLLSVLGHVQIARLNPQGGSLQAIETEVRNARDVLDRIGQYSGQAQVPSVTIPLFELVESALRSVEGAFLRGGVKIIREIQPDLNIKCDVDEFKAALGAVLRNSVEAMEKNLRKNLTLRARSQNGSIVLEIEDTGEGILPENIQKVFEPFFTTRSTIDHRGLGLAMAAGVFRQHKADVQVKSRMGEGTCITLKIPMSQEIAQSLSDRSQTARPLRELKTPSMEALAIAAFEEPEMSPLTTPIGTGAVSATNTEELAIPTSPLFPSSLRNDDALSGSSSSNAMELFDDEDDADGDFQFGRIGFSESKPTSSSSQDLSRAEQIAQEVIRSVESAPSSSPVKRLKKKEEPLASMKVQIPRPEERL